MKSDLFFQAQHLSKTFFIKGKKEIPALREVSLSLREGSLTAVVGPDGAGKTTLMRIIAGLLRADEGSLFLDSHAYAGQDAQILERIGYMPQKFGLYEDLTVQENLDLYADLRNVPSHVRQKRMEELLDVCNLNQFRNRLAENLSGGMKQKLGLICTLIDPPDLLLLDEPSVGVDPLSRRELWEIVQTLTQQHKMTLLVTTSSLDEAERADNVLFLFEGKCLASGPPAEICAQSHGLSSLLEKEKKENLRECLLRVERTHDLIDACPERGKIRLVSPSPPRNAIPAPSRLEDSFMLLLQDKKKHGNTTPETPLLPPPHTEEIVIQTEHVFRYFGSFAAVKDVSFSVKKGEVFGLLGPNGAGKTTTFRMLCGLLRPSRGKLVVAGVDVEKARSRARGHVGYVAQKFSLYAQLTVLENLEFFAGLYGLRGTHARERISAVVEDFGLEEWLNVSCDVLSLGTKRSLAMAAALLHEPGILFLDEPTSGADPLSRRAFWRRIAMLSLKGVTTVVTTHFMEEAEYCDRILIQVNGEAIAYGTPDMIRACSHLPNASMEEAFIAIVEGNYHAAPLSSSQSSPPSAPPQRKPSNAPR